MNLTVRRGMPLRFHFPLAAAGMLAASLLPLRAHAHAIAGDRVFPATLSIDDPGVSDEFNLQYGHQRVPGDDGDQSVNTLEAEWDKLITPNFAVSFGGTYVMQNNPTARGFDNFEVGAKYQIYVEWNRIVNNNTYSFFGYFNADSSQQNGDPSPFPADCAMTSFISSSNSGSFPVYILTKTPG